MQKNPRSVFCQVSRNSTEVTMALHSTVNFFYSGTAAPESTAKFGENRRQGVTLVQE
jgi:hypothetical protein